jgi:hypothetical protein
MALNLMANSKQVPWTANRLAAKIEEMFGNENVFAGKVDRDIFGPVDTEALLWRPTGEIRDAFAQSLTQVLAFDVGNAERPSPQ